MNIIYNTQCINPQNQKPKTKIKIQNLFPFFPIHSLNLHKFSQEPNKEQ